MKEVLQMNPHKASGTLVYFLNMGLSQF